MYTLYRSERILKSICTSFINEICPSQHAICTRLWNLPGSLYAVVQTRFLQIQERDVWPRMTCYGTPMYGQGQRVGTSTGPVIKGK